VVGAQRRNGPVVSAIRRRVSQRLEPLYRHPRVARLVARHFLRSYFQHGDDAIGRRRWLGHQALKLPTDLWVYQEILVEVRPRAVVETGTYRGGSAIFLASILDQLGEGRVISIDVDRQEGRPEHPRITYVTGSSTDPGLVGRVYEELGENGPIVVILDSDHTRDHVLAELRAYADLVTPGSYMIVEDTCLNGNPVVHEWGPGPAEAVDAFLAERADFERDSSREAMMLTANPGGYLLRTR
jgi:cephalosporin hydroxylase